MQGTRNTTLLVDEGVKRRKTFDLHRTKVEYKNAFDSNLFGVVHVVTHKGGTKDISHSSLDFLIIANKG